VGARRVLALWAIVGVSVGVTPCAGSPRIYMPNPNIKALIISEI